MDPNAELIEEYKTLRAEILQNLNNLKNIQTFWFGIIIPGFTLAAMQNGPWAFILVWIFNWYSWDVSRKTISNTTKISSYISIFIEEKTDIKWETYVADIEGQDDCKKQYKYSRILIPHMIFSLIIIASSMYRLSSVDDTYSVYDVLGIYHISDNQIWMVFLFIFFIANLIYFIKKRQYYEWIDERAHWRKVWENKRYGETLEPREEMIKKK